MTLVDSIALFALMGVLAALPSSSVLLVVTQSTAFGTRNGVAGAMGVVAGDLVLMTIAILGMTALAQQMGTFFVVIKYLAAAYLVWFGVGLIRSARRRPRSAAPSASFGAWTARVPVSFLSGLLLTLGDIKAIVFYASLLPAFVDLGNLSAWDVAAVAMITIIAVGGVKTAYALAAGRALRLTRGLAHARALKTVSGGVLVGVGAFIATRD